MSNKLPPATQRGNGLTDAKKVMSAQERGGFNKTDGDGGPIVVGARQQFQFAGTKIVNLSLDPREFKGQSQPQITEAIMKLLKEIDRDVDFFEQDVVMAADDIDGINNGKAVIPGSDPDFA